MEIFGTQVTTPYDDAYPPDADWRNTVAVCWATNKGWRPSVPEIRKDPWIAKQREYLTLLQEWGEDSVTGTKWRPNRRAVAWQSGDAISDVRFRIEPLLLTGAPFGLIALDVGGNSFSPDDIETYCRLFFDVREEDGALNRSCYLRSYNALPDNNNLNAQTPEEVIWRVAGMYYGYGGLMYMWRWPVDPSVVQDDMFLHQELMRAVQAYQMEQVIRGQVNNFDLNTILGHYINYRRLQHDTGDVKGAESQTNEMILGFLQLHQPYMVSSTKTVDEHDAETAAIQSKLLAEKNVTQHAVADAGVFVGKEKIDEMISKHMKNPVKGE